MLKNLRIEVDAHTHTVMSGHAWSTIQENCAAAAQKGMKALCMTDHGFCMKGTGTIWTPWSFSQLPDVIGGIRVYPGMEFNLWDTEGHLDEYLPGAFQHIRFGIASMHKNVMPVLDADAHTEAYIRAMDHACIDLIGHPGIPSYPIDAERLVRAVAERGRLIEINNNSFVARPGCDVNCRKIARLCMQYDVRVCVDSDAHFCANVGEVPKALEMLELARARGVDIRLDSGMYKDWCSSIGSALFEPVTMRDNGIELRHLRVITGEHIGLVPDQALYEHLRAAHPCDAVVVNTGSEEAVYTIQRYPMTMVSTDTGSYAPGEGHPQIAGSFPRYLRKMVIERGELSWEQAIAHTTLLPAQTMGLGRKGRIRAGMDADLLVFDPETICDRADFPGLGRPDAAPEGIRFVIVSGEIAAENGRATGVMAGKTLDSFDFIHSSRRAMAGD